MKRMVGAAAVALSLAFVGAAQAQPAPTETIATILLIPSFPTGHPAVATYTGTFQATGAVTDSGTVTAQALFAAVPAPSTGVLQTTRTLTGSAGTITLRCVQIAKDFTNLSDVPDTGTCAVLSATGAYAGLHGSGKLTGSADFTTGTVTDTLLL